MNRLVVLAPNWLGDVVMALPALLAVRRWFPSAQLAVAARSSVAPVLTLADGIDEVVTLSGRPSWRDSEGRAADAARLREGRFDAALLLPNSFHVAWLVRRAGIAERWGYRRDGRGPLLTRPPSRPSRRVTQAEYYAHLIRTLGGPDSPMTAALRVDDSSRAAAAGLLTSLGWQGAPLVAFAPGAAFGPAKRWPEDRVAAVVRQLVRDRGAQAVLVGAGSDVGTIAEVLGRLGWSHDGVRPPVLDLGGRTDLVTLAAVFAQCRAVVSNDSGAMHLAAAVGTPVTAIFGPTDERATAPLPYPGAPPTTIVTGEAWCRPCLRRYCPIDHRCMTSIPPAVVAAAVLNRWPVEWRPNGRLPTM